MQISDELVIGEVSSDSQWHHKNPNFCTMQVERGEAVERGTYVRIQDEGLGKAFIGRIVDGPYFVSGESQAISGATIRPLQKLCTIELTSILVNGQRSLVQTRPAPGSKAFIMAASSVQEYIGAAGDLSLGRLASDKKVKLHIDSRTLNRHLGVFGTTGSGKSNTLQVITEEASRAGLCVLIFDVEGEYVKLN